MENMMLTPSADTKQIVSLIKRAFENGISLFLDGEKLKLEIAKDQTVNPEILQVLKEHKEAIIDFLKNDTKHFEEANSIEHFTLLNREEYEHLPLSFSQESLWFIDKLHGSVNYHLPTVLRIHGEMDHQLLEEAFQAIVNRHEVLRTVFEESEGAAFQKVLPKDGWQMTYTAEVSMSQEELAEYIKEERDQPFDLSKDHMIRAHLLKLNEKEHLLIIVMHHIASDGWSNAIFVKELVELFLAKKENRSPNLAPLEVQYADYALWQRSYLSGELLEKKLNYWEEKLSNLESLNVPTDFPRPLIQSVKGDSLNFNLGKTMNNELQELAQKEGVTVFMLMLAVLKVLFYRYSGQEDICIGTPIANRTHTAFEPVIGFFINTLALRSNLSGNPNFKDFLAQVKETTLEGYTHQDVPFEKIVDRVVKTRDLSRNPIIQILFGLHINRDIKAVDLGNAALAPEPLDHESSQVDMIISTNETQEGLNVNVKFCSDLYTPQTIQRMMEHYEMLLQSVVQNVQKPIGQLSMLTSGEEKEIIEKFNNTAFDYPADKSIVELFEAQAKKTPEQPAIVYKGSQVTYGELNHRADRMAHYLRTKYQIQPDDLIGIMMGKSEWAIIAILGILKSGAAYVPIDPDYPMERKEFMIQDSKMKTLIIESDSLLDVAMLGVDIFSIDIQFDSLEEEWEVEEVNKISARDLAYVIYTSGSTGQPKGVKIEHRSVVNEISCHKVNFDIQADDRILQAANFAFDVSVEQIFLTLVHGATMVLIAKESLLDHTVLEKVIETEAITHLHLPPALLKTLDPKSYPSLKRVLSGAETVPLELARAWSDHAKFYNKYGPTETTINSSIYLYDPEKDTDLESLPIGKPLGNTQYYIVDQNANLVPKGIIGELYIGGDNLARGYLNNPALTDEKFIPNPFADSGKVYKTGDLVKWLLDGNVAFLGRKDNQVKIRGYRIELGEIEKAILQNAFVQNCAVLVKEDEKGNKRLVAYIASNENKSKEKIHEYLKNQLPDYMVPTLIVEMDQLPITPNGKVDRKALPEPDTSALITNDYVAPRNDIENALVQIWEGLLNSDNIGVNDNFFELGGDSIMTIQAVSRAKKDGYHLLPRDLFEHQTIASLANLLAQNQVSGIIAEQEVLTGEAGLSPIQLRFFEQDHAEATHYNQAILLNIDKSIKEKHLKETIQDIVAHHDALRFFYRKENDTWIQEYHAETGTLDIIDLRSLPISEVGGEITKICQRYQEGLNLEKGELIKATLIKTPAEDDHYRLFVVIHHLAVDGVSWRILMDHVESALTALAKGLAVDLGPKSSSYREWVKTLTKYASTKAVEAQHGYWKDIADAYQPLPTDLEAEKPLWRDAQIYSNSLNKKQTKHLLKQVNQTYQTEINDILLAALAKTISEWTGEEKVVIGMEGHGREDIFDNIDITNTIGWFTCLYPISLPYKKGSTEGTLIKATKEQLRAIPQKGLGYGALRYLHPSKEIRSSLSNANWDVVFNYLGQFDNVLTTDSAFGGAEESSGIGISQDNSFSSRLIVNGSITNGQLNLAWTYSNKQYLESTIAVLAKSYVENLTAIIEHCVTKKDQSVTPSDFGLNGKISYEELDELLGLNESEDDGVLKF